MNKKSMFTIVLLVLVAVSAVFVGRTYARYISEATSSGTVQVAKWAMKVGTDDITPDGKTEVDAMTLTVIDNPHVTDGKIAPDSSAYGMITLDPTGTEVSFDYELTLGNLSGGEGIAAPTNMELTVKKCKVIGACDPDTDADWENLTAIEGKYSGSVALGEKTVLAAADGAVLLLTATWPNEETNNKNDTEAGVAAATLTVPFDITVKQHIE